MAAWPWYKSLEEHKIRNIWRWPGVCDTKRDFSAAALIGTNMGADGLAGRGKRKTTMVIEEAEKI
jgi:hypothetical protein